MAIFTFEARITRYNKLSRKYLVILVERYEWQN